MLCYMQSSINGCTYFIHCGKQITNSDTSHITDLYYLENSQVTLT